MMENKLKIFIFTTLIACLVAGVFLSKRFTHAFKADKNDIVLQIPEHYIQRNRFFWIRKVKDLDSNNGSVLVKIPAADILHNIRGAKIKNDLVMLVNLLSDSEIKTFEQNRQERFIEIVNQQSNFNDAYEVLDQKNSWYKVYQNKELTSNWYVFLNAPYSGRKLNDSNNLIAICGEDELIGVNCKIITQPRRNIAIEFSLNYENLKYRKEIEEYLFNLIESWRK